MISSRVDFLNKNMYRKYPIRATSSHTFTDGTALPQSLITSIQLTTTFNYYKLYISQVYVKNDFINITIKEETTSLILGCFSGNITSTQQSLVFQPFQKLITGNITISGIDALNELDGMYHLTATDGRLEDSTVYCFIPPGVTSINNAGNSAVGALTLLGDNISFTEESVNVQLNVINTAQIISNNNLSSKYGNCPTPLIKRINSVYPNSIGNIDVYGISPLVLTVTDGELVFSIPTLDLKDVCPERDVFSPPLLESDGYITSVLTATEPEWKSWPQFS